MIERLFRNLAPALNQDPQKSDAIQITSESPLTVVINDGTIQIQGLATYQLSTFTIASLASTINSLSGLSANAVGYGELSSLALVDGTYSISGILPIFTSPLWQFGMALSQELDKADQQTNNAFFQVNPRTASGVWLNSLGTQYNVPRIQNEPDSLYGIRIFDFSLARRLNNISIQRILNDLGYKATVTDVTPGPAFEVNVTLPTSSPDGFVYSTDSLSALINSLKASGVQATVVLQGDLNDTTHISDSITQTISSASWKVGDSITIGQFTV